MSVRAKTHDISSHNGEPPGDFCFVFGCTALSLIPRSFPALLPSFFSSTIILVTGYYFLVLRSSFNMHVELITLCLALAGMSATLPTEDARLYEWFSRRAVSPGNTCRNVYAGANKSYSCDATVNSGGCCSQYGKCISLGLNSPFLTWDVPSKRRTSERVPHPRHFLFLDNADSIMKDIVEIQQTIAIQTESAFGTCNPSTPPAPGGTRGPNNGGATCSDNQCCSSTCANFLLPSISFTKHF
jgi:hypothetical protein